MSIISSPSLPSSLSSAPSVDNHDIISDLHIASPSFLSPTNAMHNNRHHNHRFLKSVNFPQQYSIGLNNETNEKKKILEITPRKRNFKRETNSGVFDAGVEWNINSAGSSNPMVHNPGKRKKIGNYNIYSYSPPSDCE